MEIGILLATMYLLAMNIAGIFVMGQDKALARKYAGAESRISEGWIFFLAIIGGALGVYIGMFVFRHKTQKLSFLAGMPILLVQQILLVNAYFKSISFFAL